MKKYSILVAAFAMLAFAGCNKEEQRAGQVALNFGGEEYVSLDKQAYQDNLILFTAGDQAYVNDSIYNVDPQNNGRRARIWADATDEGTYEVHYPAASVWYDDVEGEWKTTFASEIDLIPAAAYTEITATGSNYPVWPMSGYVENINAVDSGYTFKLLNNVAILSPAVKYGPIFAEAMWSANGIDPQGWVREGATSLPTLTITKVVLSSEDVKLVGDAHLVNPQATEATLNLAEPKFVMDEDYPEDEDVLVCNVVGGFEAIPTLDGASSVNTATFGNIPLAPCETYDNEILITYYFQVTFGSTTRYYKYTNTVYTSRTFTWIRNYRTTLNANFYNPNLSTLADKIEVSATPFGDTPSK